MPIQSTVRNAANLGGVVYQARIHAGLSQQRLAEQLGVSKQLVWDLENGHATKAIERLFDALTELGITLTATIPDPPETPSDA